MLLGKTAVMAQEPVVQSGAPVAITPAPAPAPAPPAAADAPKVTARKEDEEESAPAPAPVNPNLSFLKNTVAKLAGIPTETSNAAALTAMTAERDALRQQLATAQANIPLETDLSAAAHARAVAAEAQLAEMNTFLDQIRTAPANLLSQDPATLPPGQAAAATAISRAVATELHGIGQPPNRLPGPGADKPDTAPARTTSPGLAQVAASYWSARKAPWTVGQPANN